MIIFITGFVLENSERTQILIAFWIYIASMVLFAVLHIMKWYYYCCGRGKENFQPWMTQVTGQDFLNADQKKVILEMANDFLKKIQARGSIPALGDGNPESIPDTDRPMTPP
jgi:hypothetical protein